MLADKSASDISLLGFFNVFCMFGGKLVAGYLIDRYGPKDLRWGSVIWPTGWIKLLAEVGFGWAVRIVAFIELPLLIIGCLSVRAPVEKANHTKANLGFSCVKNPVLIILTVGLFIVYFGLFTAFFYIEPWASSLGLDSKFSFYKICIVNAASHFGSGITMFSLAYGFTSGLVISLQEVCEAKLVPPTQFGIALGSVMTFLSIAQVSAPYPADLNSTNSGSGLLNSSIKRDILDVWGYLGMSLFSEPTMLLGGLVLLAARLQHNSKLLAKA
ncbi:hypothetical protein BOTNAR_0099g00170 [Botryotinia narcissicola]|uniref:Major facilitator superfamily (MFS) profile domain-containing protein n=1 Tax=Botryotinia narcissicola TaxID=278944 RepID=A0A4Z1IVS5_9HELO|nr:hypothetical protein BOTNAR_0099g00170 [Botryotinia narcissicola]